MNGILTHTQPYLKGGSAFTDSGTVTSPTLAQVNEMIDRRVADVALLLAKAGYSTTQTVADVLRVLTSAVVYGVLMEIELGKANPVRGMGETARWQLYERRWNEAVETISGVGLELLGATRNRYASNGLEFTGATWSEQDEIATDVDQKGAVFPRGFLDPLARTNSPVPNTENGVASE